MGKELRREVEKEAAHPAQKYRLFHVHLSFVLLGESTEILSLDLDAKIVSSDILNEEQSENNVSPKFK